MPVVAHPPESRETSLPDSNLASTTAAGSQNCSIYSGMDPSKVPREGISSTMEESILEGDKAISDSAKAVPDSTKTHTESYYSNDTAYTDIVWTKKVTISQCAHDISHIMNTLLRDRPDDAEKERCETALKELTEAIPEPVKDLKQYYPRNYLSEILMINYTDLVKFCSSYLNLTLSSHVTKFVVNLFYSLECWEIYHLLQMVPNLTYFLRLVDIEVTETPFGDVVSPPENYMGFNLRQGFQYPFPFPFYNYSYHTMNPDVITQKYHRLQIENYIDIRLNKSRPKKKKRTKAARKPEVLQIAKQEEPADYGMQPSRQVSISSEMNYYSTFEIMTPARIQRDLEVVGYESDQDEGYDTDKANIILETENGNVEEALDSELSYVFVPSIFQEISGDWPGLRSDPDLILNPTAVKPPRRESHIPVKDNFHSDEMMAKQRKAIEEASAAPGRRRKVAEVKRSTREPKVAEQPAPRSEAPIAPQKSKAAPPHPHFTIQGPSSSGVPALTSQHKAPTQKDQSQSPNEGRTTEALPRPPAFITAAPIPASLQFTQQQFEEASRLYYGAPSRQLDGSQYPSPQFPPYASALPPPGNIVSPQLNKRKDEGQQERSPQLQHYYPPGYQAFQPYGQPFYGADGRLFMQMPASQNAYGYPMGMAAPPQKFQGHGMPAPQNLQAPQYRQQQYHPMHLPPLGYQYHSGEAGQRHGSPHMHYEQPQRSPRLPGNHPRSPHVREDENAETK